MIWLEAQGLPIAGYRLPESAQRLVCRPKIVMEWSLAGISRDSLADALS